MGELLISRVKIIHTINKYVTIYSILDLFQNDISLEYFTIFFVSYDHITYNNNIYDYYVLYYTLLSEFIIKKIEFCYFYSFSIISYIV